MYDVQKEVLGCCYCIVDGCDGILNHPDEFIAQGKELNARIAQYGCKMFIQLSMNVGRNGGLKTPSPLPTLGDSNVITKELTKDEIRTKVSEWAKQQSFAKMQDSPVWTFMPCTGAICWIPSRLPS